MDLVKKTIKNSKDIKQSKEEIRQLKLKFLEMEQDRERFEYKLDTAIKNAPICEKINVVDNLHEKQYQKLGETWDKFVISSENKKLKRFWYLTKFHILKREKSLNWFVTLLGLALLIYKIYIIQDIEAKDLTDIAQIGLEVVTSLN